MTRVEALTELRDKVKAGEDPAWADVECCFYGRDTTIVLPQVDYVILAYRGSLDAAKALHDAVLPGWGCEMGWIAAGASSVALWPPHESGKSPAIAKADSLARAWLIAILSALIAQDRA